MNLEEIESRCLNYLRQSKGPFVPLGKLFEHCTRTPGCEELSLPVLRDFIRKHGEIEIIDGPDSNHEVPVDVLAEAGIDLGPRVILKARIPSMGELSRMMAEQLAVMTESLDKARADAAKRGDVDQAAEIDAALVRARTLAERMGPRS